MTLLDIRPKNIGIWLLGFIMIIIPIQYFSNPLYGISSIRITQEQSYEIAGLVLFSILILQNVYLSLFLLWSIFLYCYYSFASPAGACLLVIFSGLLIYEATHRIVTEKNIGIIFNFIIFFAIINLFYMAMQGLGWELLFKEWRSEGEYQKQMLGFMGLKAIAGMFLAMCIPFFANKWPKLSLTLFIPIAVSECSCAVGAAIVSYLWQIWFISRKWFIILSTILCIGGVVYAIHDSGAGMFKDRMNMWKVVMQDAVRRPIFGYGPDSFRCVTPDKQFMYWKNVRTSETKQIDLRDTIEYKHTGNYDLKKYGKFMQSKDTLDPWDNPHNEYIQLFYEFGIIPIVILGFLINDMRNRFSKNNLPLIPLVGFFLGLLVMSVGQFPFHLARVGIYIPIFLACYYKLSEKEISFWKS